MRSKLTHYQKFGRAEVVVEGEGSDGKLNGLPFCDKKSNIVFSGIQSVTT
jgi:hypothetical protein